jgi:hypothetical protein
MPMLLSRSDIMSAKSKARNAVKKTEADIVKGGKAVEKEIKKGGSALKRDVKKIRKKA